MKVENYRKGYTEDDLNYLYDVWGELTLNAIAKHLGRTVEGVISIAEKVGLGGYLYTGAYLTTGQAAEIIGVDYTTIIYWIKKDILKAKLKKIYKKKIYTEDLAFNVKIFPTKFTRSKFIYQKYDYENENNLQERPTDKMMAEIAVKNFLLQISKRAQEKALYKNMQEKTGFLTNPEDLFEIKELDVRDYTET